MTLEWWQTVTCTASLQFQRLEVAKVAIMTCSEQLSASLLLTPVLKFLLAGFCCGAPEEGKNAETPEMSIYRRK